MIQKLATIAFLAAQILFLPSFITTTDRCLNTDKPTGKYKIILLFLSPVAVYAYISILSIVITLTVKDAALSTMIASLADILTIFISILFAWIYAKLCNRISKWHVSYYMTIYMFFALFQMSFNWTYNTLPGILLCEIIVPVCTLYYFNTHLAPIIAQIKAESNQAKPSKTIFALSLISAMFFVVRSILIMNITHLGLHIVTNSVLLNTYMTVITYLILIFLFVSASTIATNIQHVQTIESQSELNEQLTNDMIMALVKAINIKDKYTNGHSLRVAQYAKLIAEQIYPADSPKISKIYQIALLHDIGKLGIPDEIINKPGRLTDAEFDIIKSHPLKGAEILGEIKSLPDIIYGAKYHHERYDGKGYPIGLKGDQIPDIAALIAVADAYDAMTSKRSYKEIMPQSEVRNEIEKNIGKQFHPKYAKIMLDIINADTKYELHQ